MNLSFGESREPAVAGVFYPADPAELKKIVQKYISEAKVPYEIVSGESVVGIVAPHAGYIYSGPVAGYSFKALEGKVYETVVVLAVNHRVWGFRDISIWPEGEFKTPLGDIPVDDELTRKIIKEWPEKFVTDTKPHLYEHSLEVELPFLQVVLKDFKLVPVVMGDYTPSVCERLAEAIYNATKGKKVLVVASTDLSHDMPYDTAVRMDRRGLEYVEKFDFENLIAGNSTGKIQMCGFGPVLTLMYYAQRLDAKAKVLKYANSGNITGNKYGRIVGYGAVVFYKPEKVTNKEDKGMKSTKGSEEFSTEERKELLKIARQSIIDYLSKGKVGPYPVRYEKFKQPRGVFVTLHKDGALRGCIGYIEPIKPLQEAVVDNAINAAVRDFRFPPVQLEEMDEIDIEISVLTVPEEISSPEEFIVGKHGIIIRKGFRSAVFLPQVAPEQGWDKDTTLAHLCLKAGLMPDEWKKPGMKFYVFTAEVFGEKELKKEE